jgi:hypothetical protein
MWAYGSLHGSPEAMQGWVPGEKSLPARFIKVIEIVGKVKRNAFYDSAQVSNLSTKKAGYIVRVEGGYVLTEKGKKYLKDHPAITVDVKEWMETKSSKGRGYKQ